MFIFMFWSVKYGHIRQKVEQNFIIFFIKCKIFIVDIFFFLFSLILEQNINMTTKNYLQIFKDILSEYLV